MYNHKDTDKKWQDRWEESGVFHAEDFSEKEKFYCLIEFPYPSGDGLHLGHPRSYTALDVVSRKKRMEGKNVLYPIGWDAFGLPTENYAIKTGRKPQDVTKENTDTFRRQLKSLGISFDWSREVNTTDPAYYKWTQRQFLEFFKNGLAYKAGMAINWCLSCKIGLANEEVVNGKCERCGGDVEKRDKEQWMIGITKYADRLLEDLDTVDYLPKIKKQQQDWIGKSVGGEIVFDIQGSDAKLPVFTTRPDTIFGTTYMVVAPDHPLVDQWKPLISNWDEVDAYRKETAKKSDMERSDLTRTKSGAELKGVMAINPVNQEKVPVWIADYILMGYGTGAIMAVPAHDDRDFHFAIERGIPVVQVVDNIEDEKSYVGVNIHDEDRTPIAELIRELSTDDEAVAPTIRLYHVQNDRLSDLVEAMKKESIGNATIYKSLKPGIDFTLSTRDGETQVILGYVYAGDGPHINSEFLNGLYKEEAIEKMIEWLQANGVGRKQVAYKLRDWVFSRQRYWGEPIPLVHCDACEQKKEQVMMFHGWAGSTQTDFFASLRKDLEQKGHEVFMENAPNAEAPKIDEWVAFAQAQLEGKDTSQMTLVGHSMGGHLVLKLAEQYTFKRIILVAPVGFAPSDEYFAQFSKDLDDEEMAVYRAFQDHSLDVNAVKKNVGQIEFFFSDNDKWITSEIVSYFKNHFAGSSIHEFTGLGHFQAASYPQLEMLFPMTGGWVPVPEDQLPVELPDVEKYQPTDTGESPLAAITDWVHTTCPQCGGPATRETDTMPNWAGSSWYFLRYIDPHNNEVLADPKKLEYWMPINLYNGGMEHTVLHLLYSRFWNKVMYDLGHVPTSEPYARRHSHGLILAEDGTKMSKSKGNVINPDEIVDQYGADSLRMFEMFMGPFEEPVPWSTNGLIGVKRFLDKVSKFDELVADQEPEELTRALHKTIKKVTQDIDGMRFNTAVAQMMTFVNVVMKAGSITKESLNDFLTLLCPFSPHASNELFERLGGEGFLEQRAWPKYDESMVVDEMITLAVQVNGKLRGTIEISPEATQEEAQELAMKEDNIAKHVTNSPKKVIYVQGKLLNYVV